MPRGSVTRITKWAVRSGKFADFVILAEDPLAVEPERLAKIQVLETWVGGRQVYAAENS